MAERAVYPFHNYDLSRPESPARVAVVPWAPLNINRPNNLNPGEASAGLPEHEKQLQFKKRWEAASTLLMSTLEAPHVTGLYTRDTLKPDGNTSFDYLIEGKTRLLKKYPGSINEHGSNGVAARAGMRFKAAVGERREDYVENRETFNGKTKPGRRFASHKPDFTKKGNVRFVVDLVDVSVEDGTNKLSDPHLIPDKRVDWTLIPPKGLDERLVTRIERAVEYYTGKNITSSRSELTDNDFYLYPARNLGQIVLAPIMGFNRVRDLIERAQEEARVEEVRTKSEQQAKAQPDPRIERTTSTLRGVLRRIWNK